jgi:hypothetical protein
VNAIIKSAFSSILRKEIIPEYALENPDRRARRSSIGGRKNKRGYAITGIMRM